MAKTCQHKWREVGETGGLLGSKILYQCEKCKTIKTESPLSKLFG